MAPTDSERSPAMQSFVDNMRETLGISDEFAAASEHPYTCRCDICKQWWIDMGPEDPDEEPSYGPFTVEEIEEARKAQTQKGDSSDV
jgi:hypothetical protein